MFVKICGITSEEDALLCVAMGADAVGFVFAPSPRQIAPGRVGDIVKRLPHDVMAIGVFRNEAPKRVVEIMNRQGLHAAQLHGVENVEDTRFIAERVPRVIKAFVAGSPQLDRADDWGCDPILVDAATPGAGKSYDYSLALAAPPQLHVVLAGGLNPQNVAGAIKAASPWGVDVSSGVEKAPGVKEARLVAAFINAAKTAEVPPRPQPKPKPQAPLKAPKPPLAAAYDWANDPDLADGTEQ